MSDIVAHWLRQLESLPPPEREALAYELLRGLEPSAHLRDTEFDAELDRRIKDVTSGSVEGRPAWEVLESLHE